MRDFENRLDAMTPVRKFRKASADTRGRPGGPVAWSETGQQLPYAAVVELRPVDPQSAAEYLFEGQVGAGPLGALGRTSATTSSCIKMGSGTDSEHTIDVLLTCSAYIGDS
jgi:hypothetical protein